MTPARAGPAVRVIWKVSWSSASAAGSWPAGSIDVMSVLRAGALIAPAADDIARRHREQQVQRPHRAQPEEGQRGQRRRHRHREAGTGEHQLAPVASATGLRRGWPGTQTGTNS